MIDLKTESTSDLAKSRFHLSHKYTAPMCDEVD